MVRVRLTNFFHGDRTLEIEAVVDERVGRMIISRAVAKTLDCGLVARRPFLSRSGSVRPMDAVGPIRLEALGRDMTCDAVVDDDCPSAVIGLVALGGLDLVVDPGTGDAVVNPAHPDGPVYEI
jgi:hypothetical protein